LKLFPSTNHTFELRYDRSSSLSELKLNTKLSKTLFSEWTNKAFIGQISENGFKLISSEIGFGAFCVLTGKLNDNDGKLEIRIHKVFRVLLSIILLLPIIGFGLSVYRIGISKSIGLLFVIITAIAIIRFVAIELTFRMISQIGLKKLIKIIEIKKLKKSGLNEQSSIVFKRRS